MNKLKRMNGRERTFLLITIPILALFSALIRCHLLKVLFIVLQIFEDMASLTG